MAQGQLDVSGLTLGELKTISENLAHILKTVAHQRIVYPAAALPVQQQAFVHDPVQPEAAHRRDALGCYRVAPFGAHNLKSRLPAPFASWPTPVPPRSNLHLRVLRGGLIRSS